jgi:high-affinity K+ transport system ATPase subunit B
MMNKLIARPRLEALVVCDAPEAAYHLLSALKVDGIEDASVANLRAGSDRCLELPATNPK